MSEKNLPRRRIVIELKLGADTLDEAIQVLDQVAFRLHEGFPIECVSGGPGSGYSLSGSDDPAITHESYFAEIDEWRKAERLARPAAVDHGGETHDE